MGENKTNKEAVKDYHKKLSVITIRIPQSDTDYKAQIQDYAKSKGLSLNSYILELIENDMNKDMNITIPRGVKDTKQ